MATEDPISERTGLIRRTTLGRNDFVQDDAPENPTLKVKLTDYGRESADGLPPLPPKPPKRFKTVSTLVIAMNRFKGDSGSFILYLHTARYAHSIDEQT
jgi:hypothetical protein